MLVRNVMSKPPACCKASDNLVTVAKAMLDHKCGFIPICDGDQLVGVITDRDIVCRAVAAGKTPADVAASEVMSRNVHTVWDDEKIDDAIVTMERNLTRRLPVLDQQGKLVGIVSEADLLTKMPTYKVARGIKVVAKKTRKEAVA